MNPTEMFHGESTTSKATIKQAVFENAVACSLDCREKCQQLSTPLLREDLAQMGQAIDGKIVCGSSYTEEDGSTTPAPNFLFPAPAPGLTQQKILAFAPMTKRYFPPLVQAHANDSHHELKVSCGSQTLRLTPVLAGFLWPSNQKAADLWSKTSTTCCPPQGVFQNAFGSNSVDQIAEGEAYDQEACYRSMFGETESCEAKFTLKIEECPTCNCLGADGKTELVKVDTKFVLLPRSNGEVAFEGCGPW